MKTATPFRPSAAEALAHCSQPAVRYLQVEETDTQVILSGSVPSYYLKQVAQEAVRPVLGQRQLLNQVRVSRTEA
jgi:osmotically-inducible protein OsmY